VRDEPLLRGPNKASEISVGNHKGERLRDYPWESG
jgi:hypothetical protein